MVDTNTQIERNRLYNQERKRMNDIWLKDQNREKFITDIHINALGRIQEQIDTFYLNYAKATGVSYQEAKKIASAMDIRDFQEKAKKAVKELDFSPKTSEWLKVYNLKMRVSRLELLKAQISLELNSMYDYDYKYMYSELYDEVVEEYKTQAGILGNSAEIAKEQIDKIIMMDFHGKNFSERIWGQNGYYANAQDEIFKSMSALYTNMDGYKKERERLQKKFEATEWEVMRLLKTEVQRVNSQARQEVYNQQGFTHYHYVAEPNACPICARLNGKPFKVEDREIGVNAPPMHPSCRCRDFGEIELFRNGVSTLDKHDEEQSHKGINRNTQINRKIIESSEYDNKFRKLDENIETIRIIKQEARRMLRHRSGTKFEDMAFINSKTGETKRIDNLDIEHGIKPSKEMLDMLSKGAKDIIVIHNHPTSTIPSPADFLRAFERKQKYGLIACHDGTLYKFKTPSKFDRNIKWMYNLEFDKYYNKEYNSFEEFTAKLRQTLGLELEELNG